MAALKSSSAVKDDVGKVRAEMKKVYVSDLLVVVELLPPLTMS